ncbi:ACT domain-containing protein [Salinimonas marina]|uniref:ACT domain-containing protein n=1 Tax=Salinimonas marina TaxID=2785918 RepID=UPI001C55224B|nr:ACT domain-containing protein [Salinimonas marina]
MANSNPGRASKGETEILALLAGLSPTVMAADYWYCLVTQAQLEAISPDRIQGMFRESEGITLIVRQAEKQSRQLASQVTDMAGPFACITCQVHSSLEAVGLTAAMAQALTHHNISANVVAGFYHDHLFVAARDANRACEVLSRLGAGKDTGQGQD